MGTIGADRSRAARAMTPRPLLQPHGRVRLGLEASRFPHFWVGGWVGGAWHALSFPGVWSFGGPLAPIFFHILNKKSTGAGHRMDNRGPRAPFRVNQVRHCQLSR